MARFQLYLLAAICGVVVSALGLACATVFGFGNSQPVWWLAGFVCAFANRMVVDGYDIWQRTQQEAHA